MNVVFFIFLRTSGRKLLLNKMGFYLNVEIHVCCEFKEAVIT